MTLTGSRTGHPVPVRAAIITTAADRHLWRMSRMPLPATAARPAQAATPTRSRISGMACQPPASILCTSNSRVSAAVPAAMRTRLTLNLEPIPTATACMTQRDRCLRPLPSGLVFRLAAERDYKAGWYDAGFTLECNYCHAEFVDNGDNVPAGGRRAVKGEFPVADPHAHYGAVLDSASCQVCHDHPDHATATASERAEHSNGTVNLLDPDGGAGYAFIYPADLTSDPDLSNFCANCHDADGATRLVRHSTR